MILKTASKDPERRFLILEFVFSFYRPIHVNKGIYP